MFSLPPTTSGKAASDQPQQASSQQAPTSAQLEEMEQKLPGLMKFLEADHPGMHTSDSVDFDVVIFGDVVLELDGGAEVVLKEGGCVIQNGTRHAWHNRSNQRCVVAFSVVGAQRERTT
jgi:quercetin dioxygenase-like cupin family protein